LRYLRLSKRTEPPNAARNPNEVVLYADDTGAINLVDYNDNTEPVGAGTGTIALLRPYARVGSAPDGVAVAPDGTVWTANQGGSSASHVHSDGTVVTVPVGGEGSSSPLSVVVSDSGIVYVACSGDGTVNTIVDEAEDTIIMLDPSASPQVVALDPDGETVWVARFDSTVSRISGGVVTDSVVLDGSLNLNWVAVAPDGTVYVTASDSNVYTITNVGDPTITPIYVGQPVGVAVAADGVAWVTTNNNTLASIEGETVTNYPVGASPEGVAVAPDGKVWVANSSDGTVSVFNPITETTETLIGLGYASNFWGVAVAQDGTPYVTELNSGIVFTPALVPYNDLA